MAAIITDKMPADVAALLNGQPELDAALIAKGRRAGRRMETAQDAKDYLDGCRADERVRRAALPEWRRHLEDLLNCVPEDLRAEAGLSLVPLCSAISRAAVIDPAKLAREAIDLMGDEAARAERDSLSSDFPPDA